MEQPELVKVSASFAKEVPIWGFHGPCTVHDVQNAVGTIGTSMSGIGNTISIMSGTHGCCSGKVGAVATRDQKFAEEDMRLLSPKTKDGNPITLKVVDFNLDSITKDTSDPVTAAMAKLNSAIRDNATKNGSKQAFLLAYCCSAGTK